MNHLDIYISLYIELEKDVYVLFSSLESSAALPASFFRLELLPISIFLFRERKPKRPANSNM
jgi:hypothetical protein